MQVIKRIRDWLVDHHWLHDWERWKAYQIEYKRLSLDGEERGGGWETRQRRSCKRCGSTKDNKIC